MHKECHSAMKDAISEVFETMFFVMVDFPADALEIEKDWCESRIGLYREKVRQQEIAFRFHKDFARMLTANLLSKREDGVAEDELEDAMKELANMVGGSYLSRLHQDAWELGIPHLLSPGKETDEGLRQLSVSYFGAPAGEIRIHSNAPCQD